VRLSMEEVNLFKKYNPNNTDKFSCGGKNFTVDDLIDTIQAQHDEIESLKNWNACSAEDHEKLVESYKRRIELEEEVEQFKIFTGEIEPDGDFIEILQCDREELIKWLGRCAWHCKKVNELDKANEQLKKVVDEWKYEAECHMDEVITSKKENDAKDTALERARRGIASIIEQYTTDFTEEELLQLCPRDKVILEYANETLELLDKALGGDTP
jgi:DNA repair ATPase RecN